MLGLVLQSSTRRRIAARGQSATDDQLHRSRSQYCQCTPRSRTAAATEAPTVWYSCVAIECQQARALGSIEQPICASTERALDIQVVCLHERWCRCRCNLRLVTRSIGLTRDAIVGNVVSVAIWRATARRNVRCQRPKATRHRRANRCLLCQMTQCCTAVASMAKTRQSIVREYANCSTSMCMCVSKRIAFAMPTDCGYHGIDSATRSKKLQALGGTATCGVCSARNNLAHCITCNTSFCDGVGHFSAHLRQNPTHMPLYSYKLQRMVRTEAVAPQRV
jgi:hypothetical protein